MSSTRVVQLYYAATALFLLLDLVFSINVRLAFLEPWPNWRIAYYLVCFILLTLMVWKPASAEVLGAIESLVTLVALIMAMALRVMIVTDEMIETGAGFVTRQEIINFVLSGSIAWLSWNKGMQRLGRTAGFRQEPRKPPD